MTRGSGSRFAGRLTSGDPSQISGGVVGVAVVVVVAVVDDVVDDVVVVGFEE